MEDFLLLPPPNNEISWQPGVLVPTDSAVKFRARDAGSLLRHRRRSNEQGGGRTKHDRHTKKRTAALPLHSLLRSHVNILLQRPMITYTHCPTAAWWKNGAC
jgi:hypothetical protein